jgi:hypothetical protein
MHGDLQRNWSHQGDRRCLVGLLAGDTMLVAETRTDHITLSTTINKNSGHVVIDSTNKWKELASVLMSSSMRQQE